MKIVENIIKTDTFLQNNQFILDIETTGLSPSNCMIYMIGIVYFDGEMKSRQYFLDKAIEEKDMLIAFAQFIKDHKLTCVIHFNGKLFDVPFIERHCMYYDLDFSFKNIQQIDLFLYAKKYKKLLNCENLKLKTIEILFGIYREDKYSGKELIDYYKKYLLNNNSEYEELLLLHNYEDIINLLPVAKLYNLSQLSEGRFSINSFYKEDNYKKFIINLSFKEKLPEFCGLLCKPNNTYDLVFDEIYSGELKFYFDNYKDYYYLPEEDMAIHKSVADFLDKDKRIKCTRENCYTKFSGNFIKLPSTPVFSRKYITSDYEFLEKDIVFRKEFNGDIYINIDKIKDEKAIKNLIRFIYK